MTEQLINHPGFFSFIQLVCFSTPGKIPKVWIYSVRSKSGAPITDKTEFVIQQILGYEGEPSPHSGRTARVHFEYRFAALCHSNDVISLKEINALLFFQKHLLLTLLSFSTAWLSQQHIKIKLKSNAELGDRAAYGGFLLIAFFFSRPPSCSPHPLVTHRNKKCKEKQMQKVIRTGSILLGACSMEPPPCQHSVSPTLTL